MFYAKKKSDFLRDAENEKLIEILNTAMNRTPGDNIGEENAWRNSVCGAMKAVLSSDNISDDIGVAVEFQIPKYLNRVDMMLSGKKSKNSRKNVIIIIELKQWSEGYDSGYSEHPIKQAYGYKKMLEWGIPDEQQKDLEIYCIAYLHNYKQPRSKSDSIYLPNANDPDSKKAKEETELFFMGQKKKLAERIKELIPYGDNCRGLKFIEKNFTGYSKKLLRELNAAMSNFILSEKQLEIYKLIRDTVDEAINSGQKKVLIIDGEMGTGKSVVALYSVIKLSERYNGNCLYVSKNRAPRDAFKKMGNVFRTVCKGSDEFAYLYNPAENYVTLTVVDEAHRLTVSADTDVSQVEDIIDDSLVSVFFLDPGQIVTYRDVGTEDRIIAYCEEEPCIVPWERKTLDQQFRCGGSDAYIRWVKNLVDNKNEPVGKLGYDVKVCDSFDSFYQEMIELNGDESQKMKCAPELLRRPAGNGILFSIPIK